MINSKGLIIPPNLNDQSNAQNNLKVDSSMIKMANGYDLHLESEPNNFIQIPMNFGNDHASAQQSSSTSSTLLKKRGFTQAKLVNDEKLEKKERKISSIFIDQNANSGGQDEGNSSSRYLEESNEIEQEENPDTKIVLDLFGGDIAPVESNSKDSNNEESGESAQLTLSNKKSSEIPNHNGIISIENIPSQ